MKRVVILLLMLAGCAHADTTEEVDEMVIVPKSVIRAMNKAYAIQKEINENLLERQSQWQAGTGCT